MLDISYLDDALKRDEEHRESRAAISDAVGTGRSVSSPTGHPNTRARFQRSRVICVRFLQVLLVCIDTHNNFKILVFSVDKEHLRSSSASRKSRMLTILSSTYNWHKRPSVIKARKRREQLEVVIDSALSKWMDSVPDCGESLRGSTLKQNFVLLVRSIPYYLHQSNVLFR